MQFCLHTICSLNRPLKINFSKVCVTKVSSNLLISGFTSNEGHSVCIESTSNGTSVKSIASVQPNRPPHHSSCIVVMMLRVRSTPERKCMQRCLAGLTHLNRTSMFAYSLTQQPLKLTRSKIPNNPTRPRR